MRPDVIVTWPTSCDYPLWRRWLAENRGRFARVIVAFSPRPLPVNLREHVVSVTPDVTYLDAPWGGGWDWRDAAVNKALEVSDAEWVWFTEQDFQVLDPGFWRVLDWYSKSRDAIGTRQGESRWHPCCLYVRRTYVERTSRDFSVTEDGDHFTRFGSELEEAGARFEDMDAWERSSPLYSHMAGLSYNHELAARGEPVTYRPDDFARYLLGCMEREDDLHPEWVAQVTRWLSWYSASRKEEP